MLSAWPFIWNALEKIYVGGLEYFPGGNDMNDEGICQTFSHHLPNICIFLQYVTRKFRLIPRGFCIPSWGKLLGRGIEFGETF